MGRASDWLLLLLTSVTRRTRADSEKSKGCEIIVVGESLREALQTNRQRTPANRRKALRSPSLNHDGGRPGDHTRNACRASELKPETLAVGSSFRRLPLDGAGRPKP